MKRANKLAVGAAVALVAAATMLPTARPRHRTRVQLRPVTPGDIEGPWEGVEVPLGTPGIDLARIRVRHPRPRPWMDPTAENPTTIQVDTWTVTLPDGRRARLVPLGAMKMLPGETQEQARKRWMETQR